MQQRLRRAWRGGVPADTEAKHSVVQQAGLRPPASRHSGWRVCCTTTAAVSIPATRRGVPDSGCSEYRHARWRSPRFPPGSRRSAAYPWLASAQSSTRCSGPANSHAVLTPIVVEWHARTCRGMISARSMLRSARGRTDRLKCACPRRCDRRSIGTHQSSIAGVFLAMARRRRWSQALAFELYAEAVEVSGLAPSVLGLCSGALVFVLARVRSSTAASLPGRVERRWRTGADGVGLQSVAGAEANQIEKLSTAAQNPITAQHQLSQPSRLLAAVTLDTCSGKYGARHLPCRYRRRIRRGRGSVGCDLRFEASRRA